MNQFKIMNKLKIMHKLKILDKLKIMNKLKIMDKLKIMNKLKIIALDSWYKHGQMINITMTGTHKDVDHLIFILKK